MRSGLAHNQPCSVFQTEQIAQRLFLDSSMWEKNQERRIPCVYGYGRVSELLEAKDLNFSSPKTDSQLGLQRINHATLEHFQYNFAWKIRKLKSVCHISHFWQRKCACKVDWNASLTRPLLVEK